jgi:hypothetical protein
MAGALPASQTGSVPTACHCPARGDRPTGRPDGVGRVRRRFPEQKRPQTKSFLWFPELTKQGKESRAETRPWEVSIGG